MAKIIKQTKRKESVKAPKKGGIKKKKVKSKSTDNLKQQKIDAALEQAWRTASSYHSPTKKSQSPTKRKSVSAHPKHAKHVVPSVPQDVDEDGFRILPTQHKNTKKWKPVSVSTLNFVANVLKSVASLHVAASTSNVIRGEQQQILDELINSILGKLKGVKVPSSKKYNYALLRKQAWDLEEESIKKANKFQSLEKNVKHYERLLQEIEDKVNQFESYDSEKSTREKLHPLLQQPYKTELTLTPLPDASYKLPQYKF